MATKDDFRRAQERIFTRPRQPSRSDQELLRKTEDDGVYPSSLNLKAIRVDRITAGEPAPRAYSEAALDELGQSLLVHGQLVPIIVQYDGTDDVFVLIDGERRWLAAQRVGIPTLHAIILGRMSAAERAERQRAAALQRDGACVALQVEQAQAEPPPAGLPEASQAIDDAMSSLDQALAVLANASADATQPLAELAQRLLNARRRVLSVAARLQPEPASETAARPRKRVRRLPTWRDG